MINHLIFDLDGTIVNSYPLFVDSFIEACKMNGIDVPCDRNITALDLASIISHIHNWVLFLL